MSSFSLPHHLRWHATVADPPGAAHRRFAHIDPLVPPGERILMRCPAGDSDVVVTDRGLHVTDPDLGWRRIRWIDVDTVGWDAARSVVVLRLWPGSAGAERPVELAAGRRLSSFAAEAVMACQLVRRWMRLTPTAVATITALREAGSSTVSWRVDVKPSSAGGDPAVAAAARRAVAELRSLTGL